MKHSATKWGGDTTGDYACLNFESCADAVPRNPALTSGQDAASAYLRLAFPLPPPSGAQELQMYVRSSVRLVQVLVSLEF